MVSYLYLSWHILQRFGDSTYDVVSVKATLQSLYMRIYLLLKLGRFSLQAKKIHQNLRIQWIQSEHSSDSCHTILSQVTDSTRINCQHSLRVELKFYIVIIVSYSEDLSFVFGNFSTMISGKKILSQDKIRNYLCSYGACN